MPEDDKKEMQEKVLVYQILQSQMEELSKQSAMLESRMGELEVAGNALEEMKGVKEGNETLVPLGAGCYAHGKLTNKNKVMVDVGAGVMAGKTVPQAMSIMRQKKAEAERVGRNLQQEIERLSGYMNKTMQDIQQLNAKSGGKGPDNEG